MHPVQLTDAEMEQLREARDKHDWHELKSWKLRYLYQRTIAMPAGDTATVIEIGQYAHYKIFNGIDDGLTSEEHE